jgi:hypothetical protein
VEALLLGRPLRECLRWQVGGDGLRWQRAAAGAAA